MTGFDPGGLYRDLYPGATEGVYLDVAAVGIVSTAVREAMDAVVVEHQRHGSVAGPTRDEMIERVRDRAAELVGGHASRVAFTQNTSTGLALVANGIDWRAGDNIVVPAGEFPSNFYPWTQLRRHGVTLREVPMVDGHAQVADLAASIDGRTRIVAISAVQYSSGWRYDLPALGVLGGSSGPLVVADGAQAVGALAVDADAAGIDVLAVGAHKWMLGPMGIGFVHLSARALDQLHPSVVGWLSVTSPFDFDHEPDLAPDARRFESGTENVAGIAGLGAAIGLVLDAGRARIEQQVLGAADHLEDQLRSHGWTILHQPDPAHRSGIVLATTGDEGAATHARLLAAGVRCALRAGGIRFSPHYFTSTDDLDHAAALR